jgi:hypothetical protein
MPLAPCTRPPVARWGAAAPLPCPARRHVLRSLLLYSLLSSPSVRRALPPVGVHSTAEQELHRTTVWEQLKTVVMLKQPWHLQTAGMGPEFQRFLFSVLTAAPSLQASPGIPAPLLDVLDVHEERVRALNETLPLVPLLLDLLGRIQEVDVSLKHLRRAMGRPIQRQNDTWRSPAYGCELRRPPKSAGLPLQRLPPAAPQGLHKLHALAPLLLAMIDSSLRQWASCRQGEKDEACARPDFGRFAWRQAHPSQRLLPLTNMLDGAGKQTHGTFTGYGSLLVGAEERRAGGWLSLGRVSQEESKKREISVLS